MSEQISPDGAQWPPYRGYAPSAESAENRDPVYARLKKGIDRFEPFTGEQANVTVARNERDEQGRPTGQTTLEDGWIIVGNGVRVLDDGEHQPVTAVGVVDSSTGRLAMGKVVPTSELQKLQDRAEKDQFFRREFGPGADMPVRRSDQTIDLRSSWKVSEWNKLPDGRWGVVTESRYTDDEGRPRVMERGSRLEDARDVVQLVDSMAKAAGLDDWRAARGLVTSRGTVVGVAGQKFIVEQLDGKGRYFVSPEELKILWQSTAKRIGECAVRNADRISDERERWTHVLSVASGQVPKEGLAYRGPDVQFNVTDRLGSFISQSGELPLNLPTNLIVHLPGMASWEDTREKDKRYIAREASKRKWLKNKSLTPVTGSAMVYVQPNGKVFVELGQNGAHTTLIVRRAGMPNIPFYGAVSIVRIDRNVYK